MVRTSTINEVFLLLPSPLLAEYSNVFSASLATSKFLTGCDVVDAQLRRGNVLLSLATLVYSSATLTEVSIVEQYNND